MRLFFQFARSDWRRSLLALICVLAGRLAEIVGFSTLLPVMGIAIGEDSERGEPSLLEHLLESGLAKVGLEANLETLLGLMIVAMGVKAVFSYFAARQVGYTVALVATRLRRELTDAVVAARWGFHQELPQGSVANAFSSETDRAAQAYARGIDTVADAFRALLFFGLVALTEPKAALAALFCGVVVIALFTGLIRAARNAGKRQIAFLRSALVRLSDALFSLKPLKAMGQEEAIAIALEGEVREMNRAVRAEVLSKEALKGFQEPLLVVVMAGTVYLAHRLWAFALKDLFGVFSFAYLGFAAANKAQREYQAMAAREYAYGLVRSTIQQATQARELELGSATPTLREAIELRDVSLRYGDTSVLTGTNLVIPAGKITTLVGVSGAGKTSIADLVLGLARPDGGEVVIDSQPLNQIDLARWRAQVGYVPQEISLVADTVAGNISLGDPDIDEQAIQAALEAAGAAAFVAELPEGTDTMLFERGARLSGGQRQRIAFARALARRPTLLILDEATTALDPTSEAAICDTVRRLRGAMTILAISHQNALVDLADQVVRVEGGVATAL